MNKSPSKKIQRQTRILDALALNPAMRVNELAKNLQVSTETVRRDFAELDATGRINRTYGGAVRAIEFEPALAERLKLHIEEREKIARYAVTTIGDVPSLFIGGGATTLHFARALKSINRRITVLTATFSIATELATNPLIEVMQLPGVVEPKEGLVSGPETVRHIEQFKAPLAVMGASAIDTTGVSEALISAALVYSAMINNSHRTLFLADNTKFESRSLKSVVDWAPDITVITNSSPSSALLDSIENEGTTVLVV